jgi:hypothetical protein
MIKQKFSSALAYAGKWRPTTRLGKLAAIAIVLIAVTCGSLAGFNWYTNNVWPDFPLAQTDTPPDPAAPQAMVVVLKRDYGWRTGDLIKVKLYLKQMPGTKVDCQTLSVNDTFELAQKPVVAQKLLKDGSTVYRIDLTLQSFKIEQVHTFTGTIGWKNGDQRNDLTIPETHLSTSLTYDGGKYLKEGADPRVSIYWYGARYVAPMVLALVIYLLLLIPAIRVYLRSLVKPVVIDHARNRVEELIAKVKSGGSSKADHLELDGLVRDRFKIGPVPASQLEIALVPASLIEFLKLNEHAIYSPDDLDDKAKAQLLAKGQTVLSRWK